MFEKIKHPGPVAVIMCGLPGSGKSTFSKSVPGSRFTYLSTDDFIESAAQWAGKTYDEMFEDNIGPATVYVNEHFRNVVACQGNFIWDQTNLTVKKRRKILSQLPKDYYKICVLVQTNDDTRAERLAARVGKTVPPHILKSMQDSFVMPTEEEGFDIIKVINT